MRNTAFHEAVVVPSIAVAIEDAPRVVGVSRTRIFQAIRDNEIAVRKAGRSTIIEIDELKRWVKSLPAKGSAAGVNLSTFKRCAVTAQET